MSRRGLTMDDKEKIVAWVLVSIIVVVGFVVYFIYGFITNCILEWPPRWDIKSCWNEQIDPAKEKAIDAAMPFVPL